MKKLFFLILSVAIISAPAFARVPFAKIPAKVTDAFQARYAGATGVEWTHVFANYKVSFNLGDERLHARFDGKGKWMESEKMLSGGSLPMAVKNSLRKTKYGDWKIKSLYEEYLPNQKPFYRVTAGKGDFMRKTLRFDHRGQLMNG